MLSNPLPDGSGGRARPRLLVVDDDPAVLSVLERFAQGRGFDVTVRRDGAEALAALAGADPDVVLVDLQMPGLTGLDVLRTVMAADPDAQVILMSGHAGVGAVVEAVKAGALDYLTKPIDFDRLGELLDGVCFGLARRARFLQVDGAVAAGCVFNGMIGRGPQMQSLFDSIRRLAPHARTVLVTGETGTGKELVAKALHALGSRRRQRFATVNCSAVVETLFESELFGHVRGAFTGATDTKVGLFEHASGGTLFLDEVGELPLGLQPKLLRAVEYGEIQRVGSLETRKADVAVIAATNRDLRAEAAAGRFRSDLFYRLGIIEIRLPALRERREDIPYLTAAVVQEVGKRLGRPIAGVTPSAERLLQQADWPGNVRELRNVLERACIMSDGRLLSERDVAGALSVQHGGPRAHAPAAPAGSLGEAGLLKTAQREQVERMLLQAGGNKVAAARLLGVSRRTLYRLITRLGVPA